MNPLKKILTNCKFNISGPTLLRNQVVPYPDVKPGALVKVDADIVPKIDGEQKLIATFTSKQLLDITGSAKFEVIGEEWWDEREEQRYMYFLVLKIYNIVHMEYFIPIIESFAYDKKCRMAFVFFLLINK